LSAATQAYSTTIVNRAAASFSGSAVDNHALDWQEVCVGGVCRAANSLMTQDTNSVYADEPGAALSIGACGGGELVRSFDVAENFTLRSVSLGFSADHTRRDDLLITLTSPASTVVQVIGPPAGSGSDYANLDVSLDDANLNSQHTYKGDDDAGEPYFDRQTRPVEPLEAFRGEESAGNWTLTVCDLNPDENEGSYNRAQLSLQPQNQAITAADWNYTQTGLDDQDYISHTLEAYAYDLVGNISDVAALTFWVDNVPPVLNVTETVPLAATGFAPEPIRLLAGTVSDGGKVQQLYALALSPSGKRLSLQVGRNNGSWWFDLTSQETGEYSLWINAIDAAGNAVSAGPFTATIVRVLAENDGPTALGTTTTFTATVLGDDANTYSFDWDFGDGAAASGQPSAVSHLYAGVDVYTATVTANKGSDIFTATTTVTVDEAINGLTAANDSPAFYGETTVLTATISAGSNATYAWNFGDGQPSAMTNEAATLHNYAAGVYTATVTALNSVSVVTATTQVQIVDLIAVNDSPTMAGQTTIFTATLLGDETSSYAWDFGDGMMDSNPSAVISHTYELPDIYTATVWVDSAAGWITATTMVTVSGLGVINNSPTSLGVPTIFTATTSLTGTVSFGWDFGDGTSPLNGASAAISHTYAAAGAYTAVVTASNTTEVLAAFSIVVIDGETPNIAINDPVSGQVIKTTSYSLRGTAADDVALAWVEISTDGGQTWQRASGDENWVYVWNVPLEDRVTHTLLARAADEVGHITVSEPVVITVSTEKPFWLYLPLIIR
jgi:PKD repeat protein/subtilisin-like proprotein convertase family protein